MSENNSGDSGIAKAFGMPSAMSADAAKAQETVVAPQFEEGLPTQKGGGEIVENKVETVKNESSLTAQEAATKTEETNPEKEYQKKALDAHKATVDLLEDKFASLKSGKYTNQELREYFDKNPHLADIANRSKRVKNDFRSLMTEADPQLAKPEATKEMPGLDMNEVVEKVKKSLAEDRIKSEYDSTITQFAVAKRIVDKDFEMLKVNAEALYNANKSYGWDINRSLNTAYTALFVSKGEPVNMPSASSATSVANAEGQKIDMTKGVQLMTMEEFSGQKRK